MGNGKNWWVTLIQGIIAILLGLYLLVGGNRAAEVFGIVAALYILIVGVIEIFRGNRQGVGFYRGIIGVVVGGLLLLLAAFDILSFYWAFTIFGLGVISVGALGLYAAFFDRGGRDFAWGPVFVNALLLLWGILIFVARMQDFDLQSISGLILVAMGVIIVLWGYFTRDKDDSEESAKADASAVNSSEDSPE